MGKFKAGREELGCLSTVSDQENTARWPGARFAPNPVPLVEVPPADPTLDNRTSPPRGKAATRSVAIQRFSDAYPLSRRVSFLSDVYLSLSQPQTSLRAS